MRPIEVTMDRSFISIPSAVAKRPRHSSTVKQEPQEAAGVGGFGAGLRAVRGHQSIPSLSTRPIPKTSMHTSTAYVTLGSRGE